MTHPGAVPARRRRWPRVLAAVSALVLVSLLGAGLWLRSAVEASLPRLDGEVQLAGLAGPVEISRDVLGIPTIRGASRLDVARGLGFVHGQDRFFQMDLIRRNAAGELAEILGPPLVETDRANRFHRFRHVAAQAWERASAEEKALLQAYADGVNAGLADLGKPPFEYLALGGRPAPWRPEDTSLVVLAMYVDLQDETGGYDDALGLVDATLPPALAAFLLPRGSSWDAPLDGSVEPEAPIPGADVVDLRQAQPAPDRTAQGENDDFWPASRRGGHAATDRQLLASAGAAPADDADGADLRPGSNNFVVAGSRSADGHPLVANDPHLGLAVPNIWYRAVLEWTEEDGTPGWIGGVGLPGTPGITIGSNRHVAWGFTNSYGDYTDLILLDPDPAQPSDPRRYLTPEGPRAYETAREVIKVKGKPDETLDVDATIWGPVLPPDALGRRRALRWVAHDPAAVSAAYVRAIERARTVDDALAVAAMAAIPTQNLVVADEAGQVAWSPIGLIPRRVGFDGRLPVSWADGTRRWDGWLSADERPRVVDPADGLLWTANARVVGGEAYGRIGDGGYDSGARAMQIRDDLRKLTAAKASDLLAVQLDDRAVFLEPWRTLLLAQLTDEAVAGHPDRAELRRLVETTWDGHAAVASAAYRLVRAFRLETAKLVFGALTAPVKAKDPRFRWQWLPHEEAPLWALVTARPAHLVPPSYADWDAALLAAVDTELAMMKAICDPLASCTWGARNVVTVRHPLSLAVPLVGRWLDMTPQSLPGDENMPRVQSPEFAASMRMVVSPGHEEAGIMHMPGGESGNPLSPFYRSSHPAWVSGAATPFLPGPAEHRLRLLP
jgi:penicillin amidase